MGTGCECGVRIAVDQFVCGGCCAGVEVELDVLCLLKGSTGDVSWNGAIIDREYALHN